ncbi:MAG: hypothetical protein K2X81_00035 [Candidatus Obscuribacterales bacterium]|nr:hypothetical protein [Candidatus Obscuribacterales bacterium]
MRTVHLLSALTLMACSANMPLFAQEQTKFTRVESHSSSNNTVNSSSSSSSSSTGSDAVGGDSSFSSETVRTEKPSIFFVPKFKQRILDLKEQITLGQTKGFLSSEEVAAFMQRDGQLLLQEEDLAKKNYPKAQLDDLEKAITLLNGDLFKAMNKKGPPPGPGSDTTDSAKQNSTPGSATGQAAGQASEAKGEARRIETSMPSPAPERQ